MTVGADQGKGFWFLRNMLTGLTAFWRRHAIIAALLIGLLLLTLYLLRAVIHPFVMMLREHVTLVTLGVPFLLLLWFVVRNRSWVAKGLVVVMLSTGTMGMWYLDFEPYYYMLFYYRYEMLEKVELDELPVTDHERIQPLRAVYVLSKESMTETETPTLPDFVRIGDEYRWTIGVGPTYPIGQRYENVRSLFSVSATRASADFSKDNRIQVNFSVGENLRYAKNTVVNTIHSFSFYRYFNYEPANVRYLMDDSGKWVQVTSLIKWEGLIFPTPEFGGVHVVSQVETPGTVVTAPFTHLKLALFGQGKWIPPSEIVRHPYLRGQNNLAYKTSRYFAKSMRFQNGFFGPLPYYHEGDTRIPNLPIDVNDQPFTTFFRHRKNVMEAKLYHYFALEPFHPDKQGLNTSLFVPGDGIGPVFVYKHFAKHEALVGVSAVAGKVMESNKIVDWRQSHPVEHRPYIRDIGGKIRFFWLTTVVTFKEVRKESADEVRSDEKQTYRWRDGIEKDPGDSYKDSIAGSDPNVVLTDALVRRPVWVNSREHDSWPAQLEKELGGDWK